MRQIMQRCDTGQQRLKGKLPAGTVVAHKTGSDDATINDVGAISLPEGRGDLIIAVLSSGQTQAESVSEGVIADVSRAAFDCFALKR